MSEPDTRPTGLTAEQHRALEVRDASVALGAGAGCGKTTVLTERFLAEIDGDDGRALSALVALTFTDKAARELRQRIRARCREKLAAGSDAGRWRLVLRALEAAPIGTFHEFSARLLRAHALDLGIDPEFTILNEAVAASLRDQAIRTAVRRMLAERESDLVNLAIDYGLGQIREALGLLLATRAAGDLDAWIELTPEEIVARWSRVWEAQGRPAVLRVLSSVARCCRELLGHIPTSHPKLQERRAELLERLPALESGACSDEQLSEVRRLARVDDLRDKAIWPEPESKEAVKTVFESLRKAIDQVAKRLSVNPASTLESAINSLSLLRLAARARREYEQIKSRRRGLDFDDLLVRTRDLLGAGPDRDVRSLAAQDAIEFVLVDEFQDTDRVQSEILRLLGGDTFFRGRMFVVGDARQSIYRFRGAEPAIFGRWRSEFPAPGRLRLTENFRSVPGVIHFVNALFAGCFPDDAADGQASGHEDGLTATRRDETANPAVTFFWAVPPLPPDENPDRRVKTTADDRRRLEAHGLARWLRTRLEAGWSIVDRRSRTLRPAHAGDVAFLFRAMTDIWPYEAALADQGFDYHTLGGSAFYAQQEVRDVVNVLSVVEDPLDAVALAGALRSPFFSLSDDALFWMARTFPGGLTEGLARSDEISELSDHDRRGVVRARALLAQWRDIKDRVPLGRLLGGVLDESGYEAALVCEFLGSRKLANTRKLVRLARDFDRQENFTLADLVGRLRADLDRPPREEEASTTDEESPAIRLMSIHQAKGLEFPIVVVPDLNRKPNPRDPLIGLHPELGLVVRPPRTGEPPADPTAEPVAGESLGWRAFEAIEADEERKESLRLFYVATTRARDHLVLAAGLEADLEPKAVDPAGAILAGLAACRSLDPGNPRASSPAFELLLERFDWRSGRCLASLPEGWPAPRVDVVVESPPEAEENRARQPVRRPFQDMEQAILTTSIAEPVPIVEGPSLPRWIDLDSPDEESTRSVRLGRLIRTVIADQGLLRGDPLAEACARAAARQAPAAGSALLAEAAPWLERWLDTPLFQELREAARARRPIQRGRRWIVTWPLEGEASTAVRGCFDVIYRDRKGRWRPVIVGTHPGEHDADWLRLMLSDAAALRCGLDPQGPAWWVHIEPGGEWLVEVQLSASRGAIDEALGRWLRQHRPGGP